MARAGVGMRVPVSVLTGPEAVPASVPSVLATALQPVLAPQQDQWG